MGSLASEGFVVLMFNHEETGAEPDEHYCPDCHAKSEFGEPLLHLGACPKLRA